MRKLNIGCGDDIREDYTNLDTRDLEGVDVVSDARDLPFEDESFDLVIAQDVLEHFWDQESVLNEWKRVVSKQGILGVRVPDWTALKDEEIGGGFNFDELERAIYGGHKNEHDQHHRLYTPRVMKERLNRAGFQISSAHKCRKKPVHWHLIGVGAKSKSGFERRNMAIKEMMLAANGE